MFTDTSAELARKQNEDHTRHLAKLLEDYFTMKFETYREEGVGGSSGQTSPASRGSGARAGGNGHVGDDGDDDGVGEHDLGADLCFVWAAAVFSGDSVAFQ